MPFSIGRKDCDSSQGMPVRNLPDHGMVEGVGLLKDMFNLNDKEAVALLGRFHSLPLCNHFVTGCKSLLRLFPSDVRDLQTKASDLNCLSRV